MVRNQKTQFFDHIRVRVGRFVHEFGVGLAALHRVQFAEPWKPARRPTYGEW